MSNMRFSGIERKTLRQSGLRPLEQIIPSIVRKFGSTAIAYNLSKGDFVEAAAIRQTLAFLTATDSRAAT